MSLSLLAEQTPVAGPSNKVRALLDIARTLRGRIGKGAGVSRQALKSLMRERLGGSDAWGDWSMRDAYDALEAAQVLHIIASASAEPGEFAAAASELLRLSASLPTQTYRSEHQVDLQQFSTPLPLAWLAAQAARIRADDLVLEPSAGTGMLAAYARRTGARLLLNERDGLRADLLSLLFEQEVSRHDGEFIHDLICTDDDPTLVLINPPFGRSENRGRDRHAGARHLIAALHRLADHGRCVAIMSPAFARDGTGAKGYGTVAEIVPPRFELTIDGQPFVKHGTSISVRLLIFDKGWRGATEHRHASSLADALVLAEDFPPRLPASPPTPPAPVVQLAPPTPKLAAPCKAALFARVDALRPEAPKAPPTIAGAPQPVPYAPLDEAPAAEDPIGIYVPWRLTRMVFPEPRPHPDQLVESMAMSSILPPPATYRPILPPQALATLSDAQMETVVFAGQAFGRDLPGRFKPNEAGTLLSPDPDGDIYRGGYMVGDGTGVGKGRQIAACILDAWCQGHRRAVWVSKSASLLLSRLCESVLARGPPVQGGAVLSTSRCRTIIAFLSRLKPAQESDLPLREDHAAIVFHGFCGVGRDRYNSGGREARPCRRHAVHPC